MNIIHSILGLTFGWLFSSSLFVSNNVKVVSNAFDPKRDERDDEATVSIDDVSINIKKIKVLFLYF